MGRLRAARLLWGFSAAVLWAALGAAGTAPSRAAEGTPVRIAVFDFELEDGSPASALLHESTSSTASLERASSAARAELAHSGHYRLIDTSQVDAQPVRDRALRNCDGCEAAIAAQLGAEQSLIGVVRRVTQTDYYVSVRIRDARTGRVLDEESANFAGGEEGWASGARMLIRHQVLAGDGGAEGSTAASSSPPCRTAIVNPISGFAECVEPRGAPVAAPVRASDP